MTLSERTATPSTREASAWKHHPWFLSLKRRLKIVPRWHYAVDAALVVAAGVLLSVVIRPQYTSSFTIALAPGSGSNHGRDSAAVVNDLSRIVELGPAQLGLPAAALPTAESLHRHLMVRQIQNGVYRLSWQGPTIQHTQDSTRTLAYLLTTWEPGEHAAPQPAEDVDHEKQLLQLTLTVLDSKITQLSGKGRGASAGRPRNASGGRARVPLGRGELQDVSIASTPHREVPRSRAEIKQETTRLKAQRAIVATRLASLGKGAELTGTRPQIVSTSPAFRVLEQPSSAETAEMLDEPLPVLSVVGGLVTGLLYLLLLLLWFRPLHSAEALQQLTGVPVLGTRGQ